MDVENVSRVNIQMPRFYEGCTNAYRHSVRVTETGLHLKQSQRAYKPIQSRKSLSKTVLSILEELQLLKRYPNFSEQEIQLLPTPSKKRQLHESETYLNGEQLKQTTQWFSEFQLRQNVKQIWERVSYECQLSNSPNPSI